MKLSVEQIEKYKNGTLGVLTPTKASSYDFLSKDYSNTGFVVGEMLWFIYREKTMYICKNGVPTYVDADWYKNNKTIEVVEWL